VQRALVSEGTSVNAAGASMMVKESYAVSGDGNVLTIDVVVSSPEARTSTLKYARITNVGGCEQWPTPCKRF
jgi:hypothetical protein